MTLRMANNQLFVIKYFFKFHQESYPRFQGQGKSCSLYKRILCILGFNNSHGFCRPYFLFSKFLLLLEQFLSVLQNRVANGSDQSEAEFCKLQYCKVTADGNDFISVNNCCYCIDQQCYRIQIRNKRNQCKKVSHSNFSAFNIPVFLLFICRTTQRYLSSDRER